MRAGTDKPEEVRLTPTRKPPGDAELSSPSQLDSGSGVLGQRARSAAWLDQHKSAPDLRDRFSTLAATAVTSPRRDGLWMSSRYVRFDRPPFIRLLTAEPPVCRGGRPLDVLANCDRLRRGDLCWCRFEAEAIAEDLGAIGAENLSDWLTDTLEPEDVEAFANDVERAINAARARAAEDDAVQRVVHLHARLRQLVRTGAGLTDQYSDDLD